MATLAVSTLLPLLFLPRCPQAMQLLALRLAARRFCMDTGVWIEDLAADTDTVAGQEDYAVTSGYGDVAIQRVMLVRVNTVLQHESRWSINRGDVLTLDPAPTVADYPITLTVVYNPQPACTDLVDWLVADYGDSIAAGAAASLKMDPGGAVPVPWFDQYGAQVAEGKYQDGVFAAKCAVAAGRKSGEITVRHERFFL